MAGDYSSEIRQLAEQRGASVLDKLKGRFSQSRSDHDDIRTQVGYLQEKNMLDPRKLSGHEVVRRLNRGENKDQLLVELAGAQRIANGNYVKDGQEYFDRLEKAVFPDSLTRKVGAFSSEVVLNAIARKNQARNFNAPESVLDKNLKALSPAEYDAVKKQAEMQQKAKERFATAFADFKEKDSKAPNVQKAIDEEYKQVQAAALPILEREELQKAWNLSTSERESIRQQAEKMKLFDRMKIAVLHKAEQAAAQRNLQGVRAAIRKAA